MAKAPEVNPATAEQRTLSVKVPPPIRLSYAVKAEVKHLNYQANGEMSWTHDGSQYEAQASVKMFLIGGRSQTSRGRITAAGLAPTRFGDKVRNEQAAHFDVGIVAMAAGEIGHLAEQLDFGCPGGSGAGCGALHLRVLLRLYLGLGQLRALIIGAWGFGEQRELGLRGRRGGSGPGRLSQSLLDCAAVH